MESFTSLTVRNFADGKMGAPRYPELAKNGSWGQGSIVNPEYPSDIPRIRCSKFCPYVANGHFLNVWLPHSKLAQCAHRESAQGTTHLKSNPSWVSVPVCKHVILKKQTIFKAKLPPYLIEAHKVDAPTYINWLRAQTENLLQLQSELCINNADCKRTEIVRLDKYLKRITIPDKAAGSAGGTAMVMTSNDLKKSDCDSVSLVPRRSLLETATYVWPPKACPWIYFPSFRFFIVKVENHPNSFQRRTMDRAW